MYNGFGVCEVQGEAEHFGEHSEPHTPCYMTEPKARQGAKRRRVPNPHEVSANLLNY